MLSDSCPIIKSGNFQLVDLKLQNNTITLVYNFIPEILELVK